MDGVVVERRIVFLDIDGTLINERQELPDSARAAIVEARSRGHLVFIATGRSMPEIYPWLIDVGFDGIVGGAGSFAKVGDEVLFEHLMSETDIHELLDYFESQRIDYILQSSSGLYPSPGFLAHFLQLAERIRSSASADEAGPDWSQLADVLASHQDGRPAHVGKGTFVCPADGSIRLADVQRRWAGRFDIVPGSLDVLGIDNGELMMRGINKGATARDVANHLGVPFEASIAFGDSDNDIEMIRDCAIGVAMGNARESVKAAADLVTEAINDDGLARGFERLGLLG